jgi:putative ABC transport system permease protein
LAVSSDTQSYARLLLDNAARLDDLSSRLIWHSAAMSGPVVVERIRRILDMRTGERLKPIGKLGRALLACLGATLLWISTAVEIPSLAARQSNSSAVVKAEVWPPWLPTPKQAAAMEEELAAKPEAEATRHKDVSRSATTGFGRARFRKLLVVGEVAFSLMLLVGGVLLVRSLIALHSVNPGFDVQHVLTARITLPATAYPDAAATRDFFESAVHELGTLPGATTAGAATAPLLSLRNQQLFTVKDRSIPSALAANFTVLGDYFQAVGIRLQQGRLFDSRDRHESQPVLVINETMARQYFPGKDAIGQETKVGSPTSPGPWSVVIGVVADVKNNELANGVRPALYSPYSQIADPMFALGFGRSMVLALKAASEPDTLTSAVRTAVARLDPQLPVSDLQTIRAQMEASLAPEWFQTGILSSFAGLALLLAAIGIYGVVSFAVTQRTREIGVRVALGATRRSVLKLVIWDGMKPVLAGIVLGIGASFGLSRLIAGFPFGVPSTDWVTFSLASVVLCVVAVAANLAPARRAASVDPVVALRYE